GEARSAVTRAAVAALALLVPASAAAQDKRTELWIGGGVFSIPLDGVDSFSDSGPAIVQTELAADGTKLRVRCVHEGSQTIALFTNGRPMRRWVVVCRAP